MRCCKNQQTVSTTPEEEIALDAIGQVIKLVNCTNCGVRRTIEILRKGLGTAIGDKT